jgi:hypothetical protein
MVGGLAVWLMDAVVEMDVVEKCVCCSEDGCRRRVVLKRSEALNGVDVMNSQRAFATFSPLPAIDLISKPQCTFTLDSPLIDHFPLTTLPRVAACSFIRLSMSPTTGTATSSPFGWTLTSPNACISINLSPASPHGQHGFLIGYLTAITGNAVQ